MGKSNNIENKKRATKKGNKKKTFKKYGKNTARGLRIKQDQMEKKATKRKAEGDHYLVKGQMEHSKTRESGAEDTPSLCVKSPVAIKSTEANNLNTYILIN